MIISEVMTREVRVASPDDTLQCAARVMEEEDFGSLPIAEKTSATCVSLPIFPELTDEQVAHVIESVNSF